jgi:hypothetical protein
MTPSTTTTSPGARPLTTRTRPPLRLPIAISRYSKRPGAVSTNTIVRLSLVSTTAPTGTTVVVATDSM